MSHYYRPSLRQDTQKLFNDCKEIFIKTHPEFKGVFISENFIMQKICETYLEKMKWKIPLNEL